MSASAALGPYRIVLEIPGKPQPNRYYYFREKEAIVNHRATSLPEFSLNPTDSRFRQLRTAEEAIARRDFIRTLYPAPAYRVFIETVSGLGPVLENRSSELQPSEPEAERQNMTMGGLLIVPASLGRWAIRFPGTNFESIYAETPEAVYEKLHTFAPHLVQYAEKYVAPQMTDEQFQQQIQQAQHEMQRARLGLQPGERLRHTS